MITHSKHKLQGLKKSCTLKGLSKYSFELTINKQNSFG